MMRGEKKNLPRAPVKTLHLPFQCLFFFITTIWSSEGYVTCNFQGQLGNQLFQAANVLAYGWENDLEPIFWGFDHPFVRRNKSTFFFRLKTTPANTLCPNTYFGEPLYYKTIPKKNEKYCFFWLFPLLQVFRKVSRKNLRNAIPYTTTSLPDTKKISTSTQSNESSRNSCKNLSPQRTSESFFSWKRIL